MPSVRHMYKEALFVSCLLWVLSVLHMRKCVVGVVCACACTHVSELTEVIDTLCALYTP